MALVEALSNMVEDILKYRINDRDIALKVISEKIVRGAKDVLYTNDGRSIFNSWEKDGYCVREFLNKSLFASFYEFVYTYVLANLQKIKSIETSKFTLDKYHEFVDDKEHLQLLSRVAAGKFGISGIPLSLLPFSHEHFNDMVSLNCNKKFSCKKRLYMLFKNKHFWLRIVRPKSKDNNPPHRDCHLKRNRKIINIYAPIAGSNEKSSLPIIPGSHFWPDSALRITKGKAFVENVQFTNPAIVSSDHGLNMITPNPKLGELMIFTPYAIHGGGRNFNDDLTRMSLEMRFWPV